MGDEYKNFIETQMKLGEEHKQEEANAAAEDIKNFNNNNATSSSSSASKTKTGQKKSSSGTRSNTSRSFTPKGSFVVKAYGRYIKKKIFLNICCHPGVQRPMGSSGKEVEDDTQPHLARQIPLLIGLPRDMKDAKGIGSTAIDVIFNPWVTMKTEHNNMFKSQVVDLAMKWITTDYPDIKFDSRWKTPNSKYKGGTGPKGNIPLPFPVDLAVGQNDDNDMSHQEGKKASSSEGLVDKFMRENVNKMDGMDGMGTNGIIGDNQQKDVLSSPASLLAETRKSSNETSSISSTIEVSTGKKQANGKGSNTNTSTRPAISMIKEVDANGIEIKTTKKKGTKKTKKKKDKNGDFSIKKNKGFLNAKPGKKAVELYGPEGSQETGFVTGRPKKGSLLDRCKVVDTRSMDQTTLDKTMKEYAETGTTSAPGTGPRTKPTPRVQKKQSVSKTTTTKNKSTHVPVKSNRSEPKARPLMTQQQEDKFDKLRAAADPEALNDAMMNVMKGGKDGGGDDLMSSLGMNASDVASLQKMLGLGANDTSTTTQDDMNRLHKLASTAAPGAPSSISKSSLEAIDVEVEASVPGLKGSFNLPTLKFTQKVTTNKQGIDIVKIIVECPSTIDNLSEMELDISNQTMKLNVAGTQPLTIKLTKSCLGSQAKAKIKKNKSLVVSVPIIL